MQTHCLVLWRTYRSTKFMQTLKKTSFRTRGRLSVNETELKELRLTEFNQVYKLIK